MTTVKLLGMPIEKREILESLLSQWTNQVHLHEANFRVKLTDNSYVWLAWVEGVPRDVFYMVHKSDAPWPGEKINEPVVTVNDMSWTRSSYVEYLRDTLIPDLMASGSYAMVEEFEIAIKFIES